MWKSPKLCDQLIRQQRSITRYNSAWWSAGNAKCQIKCLLYLLCDGDVVIYLRSLEEKACWSPRSLYVPAALLGLGVALFSSVVLPLSPEHFFSFCRTQPLIPSQKVHSTCQLVEKILGWSTEELSAWINWKILVWITYKISGNTDVV